VRWPGRTPRLPHLRRRRPGLRRLLTAGLVAAAFAVGLQAVAPAPPAHVSVVVAARDVPAGHRLTTADLRTRSWLPGTAPDGQVADVAAALGRVSAGALGRGTPVTQADLLGPGLLSGQPSWVLAVPIRVGGAGPPGLVRRGDHVDVIANGMAQVVVGSAVVLAEPAGGSGSSNDDPLASDSTLTSTPPDDGTGTVVVLGVGLDDAERLARAQATGRLTLAVRPA
jgi:pilus assembly protein CpaB